MSPVADLSKFIVVTPGYVGGRPRIAGTSVSIRRIVIWYKLGYSPEEIAREIGLSLAQVYAALTYYHANQQAIEAELAAEEAETERLEQEYLQAKGQQRV
jgi:uncharacterized protein (DUF433 family)